MKIARPEREEINEAFKLLRALGDVLQGIDPMKTNKNEDDEPMWLEDKDKGKVLDHITELYDGCNIEWLLAVLDTLISPENEIIDTESDVLDIHPNIKKGLQDSRRLEWLKNQAMVSFGNLMGKPICVIEGGKGITGEGDDWRAAIDDAMEKLEKL